MVSNVIQENMDVKEFTTKFSDSSPIVINEKPSTKQNLSPVELKPEESK